MNDPTQEQRGVNICHSLSMKRERCARIDGHEGRHIGMRTGWNDKEQHPASPIPEPVEQGASMEPENERPFTLEEWQKEAGEMQSLAAKYIAKRAEALIEIKKLSARIDEIQASENRAVEELARVREENRIQWKAGQQMSNLLFNLAQQKRFIEPDAAMMNEAVAEWDAAKVAKPLDTNEGGE